MFEEDLKWAAYYDHYFGHDFHISHFTNKDSKVSPLDDYKKVDRYSWSNLSHNGIPKTLKNEDEAFQYVWNWTSTITKPGLWAKVEKEDRTAETLKLMGNNCYTSREHKSAEKCYLSALCYAKYKGVTHGKILSNLAFLRYAKGKYHQSIELLNMCEKTKYPKKNFPKLQIRKMSAWKKLGEDRNATETFQRLLKLLGTLKLGESERKKVLDEANEVLKELPDEKFRKKCDGELIVPEMEGPLTLKAEIRKGGVRGTIVRATESIKQGEPILVEQRHYSNFFFQLCSNCYLPNEVPHPCESCKMVLYCSESCKKADTEMHKLHCTLYQMEAFGAVHEFINVPFVVFTMGRTLNAFHNFKAFSEDFETFVKTLIGCCMVVYYIMENRQILKMLVDKNIVESGLDARQTAFEIGKKLLELAVILKFNREPYDQGDYGDYSFFPQYISFEHSCIPNTSKYFSGNKIVVKAAEDIEKGQEITVYYGSLLYTNINHVKRQEELQTYYGFRCQCKACQNLHFEAELTGVIKCEKCRFYMTFEPSGFVICENCSSAKRVDSKTQEMAKFLSIEGYIFDCKEMPDKITEKFMELDINPSNNTVVFTHLNLAKNELDDGNIEKAMKIIITSNALKGPFNKYIYCHHSIFRSLQTYLKTLHSTASRHHITEKISIETVDNIEKFLDTFECLINLYYPKRQILNGIEEVRKYLSIIKRIYTIYGEVDKLDWNIVDDDKDLRETIQLSFY